MSDIKIQSDKMQKSTTDEMVAPEEKKDGDDGSNEEKVNEPTADSNTTKKKYTDWPIRDIKEPHDHDVLYGRGGE